MTVPGTELAPAALAGLVAVDLSDSVGGQYCGRLLADYGAEVVLVEPPGGSPIRREGPFSVARGDSLLFRHLNTGKRSLSLDWKTADGAAALDDLVLRADVAILPPGVDPKRPTALNPRLVAAVVSDFGTDGPLAGWKGPEIVIQALSGMMHNNGAAGREPLYGCGNRSAYAAGVAAYVGIASALFVRGATRQGQVITVDRAETAAAMGFPYVMQYLYSGHDRSRSELSITAGQVLCRGGWVCIWIYNHRWADCCRTLGLPHLIDDPRFAVPAMRRKNWDELFRIVQEAAADRDAEELVGALQDAEVIAAIAYRPSELRTNGHLASRRYWEEIATPEGPQTLLGAPYRLSRTPRRVSGPAPAAPVPPLASAAE